MNSLVRECKSQRLRSFLQMVFCVWLFVAIGCCETSQIMAQNSSLENPSSSGEKNDLENLWTRVSGDDWPQFLGPRADGKSNEVGIRKDWTGGNLPVVWEMDLGEGYGIGSVAMGRYVHFDRHEGDARVRCVNAETGVLLWSYRYKSDYSDLYGYDNGPRASPVIDGDRVYVYGVEGQVHCLSLADGKKIWSLDANKKFGVIQNFFGVASSPVVHKDLLLLMVGGSTEDSQQVAPGRLDQVVADGSGIIALNKFTGALKYKSLFDLASYSTIRIQPFDSADDRMVALAWMRASLFGFDPETGQKLFEFPYRARILESVNAAMPVVAGNDILLSECYELGSVLLNVDEYKPKVVWADRDRKRNKSLEAHWNTPIYFDGDVFGCSGRHSSNAELRCIDWKTGEVHWSNDQFSRSSLTMIDGHLIVMDESGRLALAKATPDQYEEVTRFDGGEQKIRFTKPCWAAPIVSHGFLFVRGAKRLVCFELIPEK